MIMIIMISIITQVITEIPALSLAENGVIFRYNHLQRANFLPQLLLISQSDWLTCRGK